MMMMMQARMRLLAIVVAAVLALVSSLPGKALARRTARPRGRALASTDLQTVCAAPSSVAPLNSRGKIGDGQTAANLEGDLDDPLKNYAEGSFATDYVEFIPKSKRAAFGIEVAFDEGVDLGEATEATLHWNYRGELYGRQKWRLAALKASGAYATVTTNEAAEPWRWTEASPTVGAASALAAGNTLTLKLSTNNAYDAFQIDFLEVCATVPVPDDGSDDGSDDGEDGGAVGEGSPGKAGGDVIDYTCPAAPRSEFGAWSYSSALCAVYIESELDASARKTLIKNKRAQGCNTILYDSPMSSYYRPDAQFNREAQWIADFAADAEALGVKTMIYYPSLEIITENGVNLDDTAGKTHPEWLQYRLDGTPNLFYGSQAFWLDKNMESAWMSPTSEGYFSYLMARLQKLAATGAAGCVLDVPVLQGFASPWILGSDNDATAFRAWSKARGLCGKNGCALPEMPKNWLSSQDEFKYWLVWRHHALASFLARIRAALDEDFLIMVEQYPADYDGTLAGLEGGLMAAYPSSGMSHIWEIDSVSVDTAMQYSSHQDFGNQLTMRKYARGCDRDRPTWAFSIGKTAQDAGIVMAGALAVGTNPFEHKAPYLSDSVGSSFRSKWFNWLEPVTCELFQAPRRAKVAVVHSSSSRDLFDLYKGCGYGMFVDTKAPKKKIEWWAESIWDSALKCNHLAAYRGAAFALQLLHVPFKIVPEISLAPEDLEGVDLLWLPTTVALGSEAVDVINAWVKAGGVLFATGSPLPSSISGYGEALSESENPLRETLNNFDSKPGTYGQGTGVYQKSIVPQDVFLTTRKRKAVLTKIRNVLFDYVDDSIDVNGADHVFVDASTVYNEGVQHLYVVNYAGLRQPARKSTRIIQLKVRSMHAEGADVVRAVVTSPSGSATEGEVSVSSLSDGWFQIKFKMDEFMLVTLEYAASA